MHSLLVTGCVWLAVKHGIGVGSASSTEEEAHRGQVYVFHVLSRVVVLSQTRSFDKAKISHISEHCIAIAIELGLARDSYRTHRNPLHTMPDSTIVDRRPAATLICPPVQSTVSILKS